jgi:hypothetical protein
VRQLRPLVAGFLPRWPMFKPGSSRVAFVVAKAAMGRVFSEYVLFLCHSFHLLLHTHHLPGQISDLSNSRIVSTPPPKRGQNDTNRCSFVNVRRRYDSKLTHYRKSKVNRYVRFGKQAERALANIS